jgi:hypothetical protein
MQNHHSKQFLNGLRGVLSGFLILEGIICTDFNLLRPFCEKGLYKLLSDFGTKETDAASEQIYLIIHHRK